MREKTARPIQLLQLLQNSTDQPVNLGQWFFQVLAYEGALARKRSRGRKAWRIHDTSSSSATAIQYSLYSTIRRSG